MTALQCSLEFALNMLEDRAQCREWIESALENSERLLCRLSLAREMAHAANADDPTHTAELSSVLAEALSAVEPLFQMAASPPRLQCDEIEVSGERSRLLRAFLYVLQQLKVAESPAPSVPQIVVKRRAELVEVRFRLALRDSPNKDQVASQLEIAKEIFESAGGGLMFFCFAGNDALVRVFLHTPEAQLDLYDDGVGVKPATSTIGTTAVFPQVS